MPIGNRYGACQVRLAVKGGVDWYSPQFEGAWQYIKPEVIAMLEIRQNLILEFNKNIFILSYTHRLYILLCVYISILGVYVQSTNIISG